VTEKIYILYARVRMYARIRTHMRVYICRLFKMQLQVSG